MVLLLLSSVAITIYVVQHRQLNDCANEGIKALINQIEVAKGDGALLVEEIKTLKDKNHQYIKFKTEADNSLIYNERDVQEFPTMSISRLC